VLGQHGLGPRVLLATDRCRVEAQLQGETATLTTLVDTPHWAALASQLRSLHSLPPQALPPQVFGRADLATCFLRDPEPFLQQLSSFREPALGLARAAVARMLAHREALLATFRDWPRTLCHCDLNDGNIMLTPAGVTLLDF
jgi:thiamine kinase-like enzyme